MNRLIVLVPVLVIGAAIAGDGRFFSPASAESGDPHEYFNEMVKRADHWKSYSLRSHGQMLEYRHSRTKPMYVTYDPSNDTYRKRQDAAKVSVPEFDPEAFAQLVRPLSATDTDVVLTATDAQMRSRLANKRSLRIGGEVMTIVRESGESIVNSTVTVRRGQNGTAAQPHAAGVSVLVSSNVLLNQLRFPVNTQDNNAYLMTWDAWYGPEYDFDNTGIGNYKTFQFGAPLYFFQVDTVFSAAPGPDVAMVGAHSYPNGRPHELAFGPNITSAYPVAPQVGQFNVKPETWTRYWVYLEQNASGWDPLTMWVADENRDAVKIFDALQYQVPETISQFILEYNTSSNELLPRGTLVSYVRNWVALRNPGDPTRVLQRPGAGTPLPPIDDDRPGAPRNLRIVR